MFEIGRSGGGIARADVPKLTAPSTTIDVNKPPLNRKFRAIIRLSPSNTARSLGRNDNSDMPPHNDVNPITPGHDHFA